MQISWKGSVERMRLIDADKLKNHYSWWKNENKELFDSIVDQQPTAYDVEKVVEKIHEYFHNVIDESPLDNIPLEVLEYNKAVCEIVKEGGANDTRTSN